MTRYFIMDYTSYIEDDYTDDIIYNSSNDMDIFLENVAQLYNITAKKELTEKQIFTQYIKTTNITKEQIEEMTDYLPYLPEFEFIEDGDWINIYDYCYNSDYIEDILEIIANGEYNIREDLAEFYNINYGTVGYSPWSFYWDITNDRELVNDLWEGRNFYDIAEVDENLEYLDSIGTCNITSTEELLEYLKAYFGVEEKDIVLIDNEISRGLNFPRAKVEVTYKIGEIIEQ